ncbi:Branched-chain amino acid aminotransferase, partial [Pseudomonas savastanoi pv. glycinea]
NLGAYKEAGACGTAAVITPIGGIYYGDRLHVFHSETEVGPLTQRLFNELSGIQNGDIEAPACWIEKV